MKIHFEGSYKEMLMASSILSGCKDLNVMESSWIQRKEGSSNYYYIDVDTKNAIPYVFEISLYNREFGEVNQEEEDFKEVPLSQSELYFKSLFDLMLFATPERSKKELLDKIKEISDAIELNYKRIEDFEINFDKKRSMKD